MTRRDALFTIALFSILSIAAVFAGCSRDAPRGIADAASQENPLGEAVTPERPAGQALLLSFFAGESSAAPGPPVDLVLMAEADITTVLNLLQAHDPMLLDELLHGQTVTLVDEAFSTQVWLALQGNRRSWGQIKMIFHPDPPPPPKQ